MSRNVTLFTAQKIEASTLPIVAGEELVALSSTPEPNTGGTTYNSVRVDVRYSGLNPGIGQFFIGAILEAKDASGNWTPIGYQFSPLRSDGTALERLIVIQPNIDTFNLGIDDVVFPVDSEIARISRQQGLLPETEFRLCISIKDNDPTGPNAFVEVTVDATAELYNV